MASSSGQSWPSFCLHRNEVVSVDRLIDELWGGQPPATATKALQVHVSQLRKAFGSVTRAMTRKRSSSHAEPGLPAPREPEELDTDRFERLVEDGRRALREGDPEQATRKLLEALSLWRGPALGDFAFDPFAQTEIARLEEARVSALEERIEADLALGRHAELIGELESLVAAYPLRERIRGQLDAALYRSGAALWRPGAVERLSKSWASSPESRATAARARDPLPGRDPGTARPDRVRDLQRGGMRPGGPRRSRRGAVRGVALRRPSEPLPVLSMLVTRGGESAVAAIGATPVGVIDVESGTIDFRDPRWSCARKARWKFRCDLGDEHGRPDRVARRPANECRCADATRWRGAGRNSNRRGRRLGRECFSMALCPRIDPRTSQVVQTVAVGNGPGCDRLRARRALGREWRGRYGFENRPQERKRSQDHRRRTRCRAIATGFGSVWVTSERTGNVSRLRPKSGAVARTINVGNGPRTVAVGAGSVWIANRLDGTVSRIDPESNSVRAVIPTAAGPSDIAVGQQAIWVANDEGASLTQIDPDTDRVVRTVQLGNRPKGLALVGGFGARRRSGAGAHASRRYAHRLLGPPRAPVDRPGDLVQSYSFAIPADESDGLVAFEHVGGSDGSRLVPDLASSLPSPTDAGKAYTFELRPGIRYSTGRVVRPEDFRRAIERLFRLGFSGHMYFTRIIGGRRCEKAPKTCDLSKGIVVDTAAQSVTFRLVAPDPDFLLKLTLPAANPVPPGIPDRDVGTRPIPGTGPYKIARYVPNRKLVFVRNPFFRVWSEAARPAGNSDRIVWRLDVKAEVATRAVETGEADVAYDFVPPELLTEVRTRYASQLHVDPIPGTFFYLLDSRIRPFHDVRVRQALNYAVDREVITETAGAGISQPTCQVLPQNFPGYRPYCPYTANPSASGRWIAPDIARARRLVAASGTRGERVTVWAPEKAEGESVTTLLRSLGYRTRLKTIASTAKYDAAIFDPRNSVQIAALRWFADYPAASGFVNSEIFDCTYFCDRRIDRKIARARALQQTDVRAANALWARIDRDLTDQAPWLFLYNRKQADFVSSRVGNFQYNLRYGILLDQFWVN